MVCTSLLMRSISMPIRTFVWTFQASQKWINRNRTSSWWCPNVTSLKEITFPTSSETIDLPLLTGETEALPLTPRLAPEEAPVLPFGLIGLYGTAVAPLDFIGLSTPEEISVWVTGLIGLFGIAVAPLDFIGLSSPEEIPVWPTGLTELEGIAASPFVFIESETPDNFDARSSWKDKTFFYAKNTSIKRSI